MDKQLKNKAITVSGKDYVQVKDRVSFFNEEYPKGKIETKLISYADGLYIVKAIVTPNCEEPNRIFTGLSQASKTDTGTANKTAPLEVAETSAVGRALAFMAIGIVESIASVDEINKATNQGGTNGTITREPVADDTLIHGCNVHQNDDGSRVVMTLVAKNGNYYHIIDKGVCFGKGIIERK